MLAAVRAEECSLDPVLLPMCGISVTVVRFPVPNFLLSSLCLTVLGSLCLQRLVRSNVHWSPPAAYVRCLPGRREFLYVDFSGGSVEDRWTVSV